VKKIICTAIFTVCLFCGTALAKPQDKVFVTTIYDTTIEKVQEVATDKFVGRKFTLVSITPNQLAFAKILEANYVVLFNMLKTDYGIKVVVSETRGDNVTNYSYAPSRRWPFGGRMVPYSEYVETNKNIKAIIPIIREIKHEIDGTQLSEIENEADMQK